MSRKLSVMQIVGIALIVIGLVWVLVAWNMNISVSAGGRSIGDYYIPSSRVVNVGLMDERRNQLMLGGLITLAGVILLGFGSLRTSGPAMSVPAPVSSEPPCARDLALEPYKLWLVARYAIVRNETLASYVCGDKLFATADEAMAHAHAVELQRVAEATARREDTERMAREAAESAAKAASDAHAARQAQWQRIRDWIAANRPLAGGIGAVIVSLAVWGTASVVQHQRESAAALRAAQSRVATATEAAKSAETAAAAATNAWVSARSAAADRLERAEIDKVEVTLRLGSLGVHYDARIVNRSRYHLRRLSGRLHIFSRGVELPDSVSFSCCDEAEDVNGFDLGYAIAPQGSAKEDYVVLSMNFAADSPQDRKFAADNGIPLSRNLIGQQQYSLDARARFDGEATFVIPQGRSESGSSVLYKTQTVDFGSLAEVLPEVAKQSWRPRRRR